MRVVEIDGSRGEGGGQILRTALALALITGRGFVLRRIRARRAKPGLQPQHVACVRAAAEIGSAGVAGDDVGSATLEFLPRALLGGDWHFRIGTAGSSGLVLQTVLVPLLAASAPSRVVIEGGTHNPTSPPFDFLARAYLPVLRRMGARVTLELERHGFYPAGGGRIVCTIQPGPLGAVAIDEAGPVRRRMARAMVSRLPRDIAARELDVVRRELGWRPEEVAIEEVESPGPGNAIVLEVEREHVTEVVTGFGQKGVPAEKVAASAIAELSRWMAGGLPVGEHLADQLMLPMAVARAGRYRTGPMSLHATTNLETIRQFLDVPIDVAQTPSGTTVTFG